MMEYALYLESGPRQRKTMIHVLDLLGCIAQGPTTEAALEATPQAIREYLGFLQRHGETVEPETDFATVVAVHVIEGSWIGNGDPATGFGPDFQPLRIEGLAVYLQRLDWLKIDLLRLIGGLTPEQMLTEPEDGSRSIYHILEHRAESQGSYLRMIVGKVDGLPEALRAVQAGPQTVPAALTRQWQIIIARLERMSETERNQPAQHGQLTWTARRELRRMLEHPLGTPARNRKAPGQNRCLRPLYPDICRDRLIKWIHPSLLTRLSIC